MLDTYRFTNQLKRMEVKIMRRLLWLFPLAALVAAYAISSTRTPPPQPTVKFTSSYALTWKSGESVRVIRVVPAPVNTHVKRELKGDKLTPATLAIQWQGLRPDGTPLEEVEVHDEEINSLPAATTRIAKN